MTIRRAAEIKDVTNRAAQLAVERGDLVLVQIGEGKDGQPVMAVERRSLDAWEPRRYEGKRGG